MKSLYRTLFAGRLRHVHRSRLLFQYGILNVFLAGIFGLFVAAAAEDGWMRDIFLRDTYHFCLFIAMIFAAGFSVCGLLVRSVNFEINVVQEYAGNPTTLPKNSLYARLLADPELVKKAEERMQTKLDLIHVVIKLLPMLGLMGTVVGFILTFSSMGTQLFSGTEEFTGMTSDVMRGMSLALNTTLVGLIGSVWLLPNAYLLETGVVYLFSALPDSEKQRSAP